MHFLMSNDYFVYIWEIARNFAFTKTCKGKKYETTEFYENRKAIFFVCFKFIENTIIMVQIKYLLLLCTISISQGSGKIIENK